MTQANATTDETVLTDVDLTGEFGTTPVATEVEPAAHQVEPEAPETPTEVPATEPEVAPVAPAIATVVPAEPAPAAVVAPAVNPIQSELTRVTALINADEFDPFSKDGKQIMMQRQDLAADLRVHQINEQQAFWKREAKSANTTVDALQTVWDDAKDEATKTLGYFDPNAATYIYNKQVAAMKVKKPDAPVVAQSQVVPPTPVGKPRIPVTSRPGAVTPPVANMSHRPAPPVRDPLEELGKSVNKDDFVGFL